MELTPRLRALADQVPQGARLADIGTDHGYLPVWLLRSGRIDYAIAADLRQGPLNRALETAAQYGVTGQMSFRLCDGLAGIAPEEADVIAIAGMGGETIAAILSAAPWTREGKLLLLQPMTSFPDLRLWLQQNGYHIQKETISREGKRLYTCLTVTAGAMEPMTLGELWAGRESDDPLRGEYLQFIAEKLRRALAGHLAAGTPDTAQIQTLRGVLEEIEGMEGAVKHGQRG